MNDKKQLEPINIGETVVPYEAQREDQAEPTDLAVPEFIAPLRLFIGKEVDRQLKYKMASQSWEIVEELQVKLEILCKQMGVSEPSAADIALYKPGEYKP